MGTSPTALDSRSLFTKAFFCSSFIPELWSRMAVNLSSSITTVSVTTGTWRVKPGPSNNLHAVVDHQRGGEAHDIRDGHEGDEVGQVNKQLRGHSGELMDEGSGHCFHGLQLSLGGLTEETKAQDRS